MCLVLADTMAAVFESGLASVSHDYERRLRTPALSTRAYHAEGANNLLDREPAKHKALRGRR